MRQHTWADSWCCPGWLLLCCSVRPRAAGLRGACSAPASSAELPGAVPTSRGDREGGGVGVTGCVGLVRKGLCSAGLLPPGAAGSKAGGVLSTATYA